MLTSLARAPPKKLPTRQLSTVFLALVSSVGCRPGDADRDGFEDDDCEDTAASVFPGAEKLCDGLDNDCDGELSADEQDADGDGFTGCDGDCDDTDAAVSPDAAEVCGGADEDCDGEIDESDASDANTFYADADGDGYGDAAKPVAACALPEGAAADAGDCDDANNTVNPAATEVCGGADEDCDGEIDEADASDANTYYTDDDGDGYGLDSAPVTACVLPAGAADEGGDCDDTDPAVSPSRVEVCGGADEDCDGEVDEADASDAGTYYTDGDGDGYDLTSSPVKACVQPSGAALDNGDCNDADATVRPGGTEFCGGADEDCDGQVDEPDAADAITYYTDDDGDGYGVTSAPVKACTLPSGTALNNGDCNDADGAINPAAAEVCGGADEDCDGQVDEDDASDANTYYTDADGDDYGAASAPLKACEQPTGAAQATGDCNDTDASINPDATEICDGEDNDCAGGVDDGLTFSDYWLDADGDGWGDANAAESLCEQVDPYVENSEDCNDADDTISPDADDSTCDGVDQDCSGADACGGFSTGWVEQEGTIGQFTRCDSVVNDGYTCVLPEIRYGNVEGGLPYEHGGNRFDTWCQQLGFGSHQSVDYGVRNCEQPFGVLFGCTSYDESTWHWCDWQDGDWYNESLDYNNCSNKRAITSITCRD